jgi:ribosomal protein L11 methyltransferase
MRLWPALDVSSLDDFVLAALINCQVAAVDEDAARVFFHATEDRDRAAADLQRQFPALHIQPIDVPDEDWAARSQANLKAVRVGDIVVAPPWDVLQSSPELKSGPVETYVGRNCSSGKRPVVIVIQPSMGFGTGHHATTRLCLSHLQHVDLRGRSVVDVGTGSGVLGIAASRLGASQVLAIDDDPDAIASARENLDLNPGTNVTLGTLDLRRATLRPFDLVIANLTGGLLIAAAQALLQLTGPVGQLILSGFMQAEEAGVLAAFGSCRLDERSQEDEWVCATLWRRR